MHMIFDFFFHQKIYYKKYSIKSKSFVKNTSASNHYSQILLAFTLKNINLIDYNKNFFSHFSFIRSI